MKKALLNYIQGNYNQKELDEVVIGLKNTEISDETTNIMKTHWKECTKKPIGDSIQFNNILAHVHHTIIKGEQDTNRARLFYSLFARVAAILIIPLTITLAWVLTQDKIEIADVWNTIEVPAGAISRVQLPDGTMVILNSGSTLKYPATFVSKSNRRVELDGEGYFQVTKQKSKHFVVDTKNMDVKVLGTIFNIRAYMEEDETVVALVEGAIEIGLADNNTFNTGYELKPNQVASIKNNKRKAIIQNQSTLKKYIAWKDGKTVFYNDPIETVINKFEKLYNVDIQITDKEIYDYRFTATFVQSDLERALKILCLSSPISYTIAKNSDEGNLYGKRKIIIRKR